MVVSDSGHGIQFHFFLGYSKEKYVHKYKAGTWDLNRTCSYIYTILIHIRRMDSFITSSEFRHKTILTWLPALYISLSLTIVNHLVIAFWLNNIVVLCCLCTCIRFLVKWRLRWLYQICTCASYSYSYILYLDRVKGALSFKVTSHHIKLNLSFLLCVYYGRVSEMLMHALRVYNTQQQDQDEEEVVKLSEWWSLHPWTHNSYCPSIPSPRSARQKRFFNSCLTFTAFLYIFIHLRAGR